MTKRMQLKLDDETHALIMELSELSGMSASGLVTAMFQMSRKELEVVVRQLRIVAHRPRTIFNELVAVMERLNYRTITTKPRRAKGSLSRESEP